MKNKERQPHIMTNHSLDLGFGREFGYFDNSGNYIHTNPMSINERIDLRIAINKSLKHNS